MIKGHHQAVVRVAVPVPLMRLFDYSVPDHLPLPSPGQRVCVSFGRRTLVGVVMMQAATTDVPLNKLLPVREVLDAGACVLTDEQLALLSWCSQYYKYPLGEVVANALPPELRKAKASLPERPFSYALTAAGKERLKDPPGRAVAQWRLLDFLSTGAADLAALRSVHSSATQLLKTLLEKDLVEKVQQIEEPKAAATHIELTADQQSAVTAVTADLGRFACHLLDGITGSGKTEVYLRLLEPIIQSGRQALVLVPEIGLTPQLLRRFKQRLGITPVVSHSGIAAGDRMRAWAAALRGDARLIIGTRSALFLPLINPALVIMDESHDPSFKQQDGFRYSARDVAVKRAQALAVPILLGTATPALETLRNAQTERYRWHRLRHRPTGAAEPVHEVVDLRQQAIQGGLSQPALLAIEAALEREEQVLVFLNRRGYAPVLLCHECGWHAGCQRCDANLTWHRSQYSLVCHHCEYRQKVPRFCPDCRADALQGAGEGTEQLSDFLQKRFAATRVIRVDRDQVRRKGELEEIINTVRGGEPCILVGTQMLAKGHHFPKVTLAIIVNLDQALYSADFRAVEKMGQVLMQVAGRAGREQHAGTVILQTHHPDHDALKTLLTRGYEAFAEDLLQERQLAQLPPFASQAVLRAEARDRDDVLAFLNAARQCWSGVEECLYGPYPAMLERRSGRVRWYLLVQTDARPELQRALDQWLPLVRKLSESKRVRWAIDVDPQEF